MDPMQLPGFGGYEPMGNLIQGQPPRQSGFQQQGHNQQTSVNAGGPISRFNPSLGQHPQMHLIQPITSNSYHPRPERELSQQSQQSQQAQQLLFRRAFQDQDQQPVGSSRPQQFMSLPNGPPTTISPHSGAPTLLSGNPEPEFNIMKVLTPRTNDSPAVPAPASISSSKTKQDDDDCMQLGGIRGLIAGVLEGRIPQEGVDIGPWHHGLPPPGGFPSFYQDAQEKAGRSRKSFHNSLFGPKLLENVDGDSIASSSSSNGDGVGHVTEQGDHVAFDGWDDNGPRLNLSSEEAGLFLWGGKIGMRHLINIGVFDRKLPVLTKNGSSPPNTRYSRSGTVNSSMTTDSSSAFYGIRARTHHQGNEEVDVLGWGGVPVDPQSGVNGNHGPVEHHSRSREVIDEESDDDFDSEESQARRYRLCRRTDPFYRLETLELAAISPPSKTTFSEAERVVHFPYNNIPKELISAIDGNGPFGNISADELKSGIHAEIFPHVALVQKDGKVPPSLKLIGDDVLQLSHLNSLGLGNLSYNEKPKAPSSPAIPSVPQEELMVTVTPIRPPPGLGYDHLAHYTSTPSQSLGDQTTITTTTAAVAGSYYPTTAMYPTTTSIQQQQVSPYTRNHLQSMSPPESTFVSPLPDLGSSHTYKQMMLQSSSPTLLHQQQPPTQLQKLQQQQQAQQNQAEMWRLQAQVAAYQQQMAMSMGLAMSHGQENVPFAMSAYGHWGTSAESASGAGGKNLKY